MSNKYPVTWFHETRTVNVKYHNMNPGEDPDEVIVFERDEDSYALMSPQLKNKKIIWCWAEDWRRSFDRCPGI